MTQHPVHHVGLTVSDLERVVEFYRDTLGFSLLDRFSVAGEGFSTAVGVEDASAQFVHLDGGDVRLELVEYEPAGERRTDEGVEQPGTKHLGLTVDDVDACYEALADEYETTSPPQTTESGSRILFVRDPEGNLVELLEPSS